MKHSYFYYYQMGDILFNIAIKTIGILFAWLMINDFSLINQLGWFIAISWLSQVMTLLLFNKITQFICIKHLLIGTTISSIALLSILPFYLHSAIMVGIVFIILSLFAIILQPIGTSLVPNLYQEQDLSFAFKIRGFITSVNIILSPILSGIVIYYLSYKNIIWLCVLLSLISFVLFALIHYKPIKNTKTTNKNLLTYLLRHPIERLTVGVSALANMSITPIIAYILPYKVSKIFHLEALYIGIGEGLFGLGMLITSVLLIRPLNHALGIYNSTIISVIIVSFGILVSIISPYFYGLCLGMFMIGMGVVIFNINSTNIRATATPESMRLGFESCFLMVCVIGIPIGIVLTTLALSYQLLIVLYTLFSLGLCGFGWAMKRSLIMKQLYLLPSDKLANRYGRYLS